VLYRKIYKDISNIQIMKPTIMGSLDSLMSSFDSLRTKSELSEERRVAHNHLKTFLECTGFTSLLEPERIEYVRSLSVPKFNSLITRINGMLRKMPPKARGNDYMTGLRITSAEDPFNIIVDYIPPKNGWQLLDDFFVQMQTDISDKNLEKYATKLKYAIAFAHVFADGNGRTSRYLQRLLSEGSVNIKDAYSTSYTRIGPSEANKLANLEILREQLPERFRVGLIRLDSPENLLDFAYAISSMETDYGYAAPLRVLALVKTNPEVEPYKLLTDNKVFQRTQGNPAMRKTYNHFYVELQDKLFWKVQELIDKEQDIRNIDGIFRERVKSFSNQNK